MSMKETVEKYLEVQPEFRERKNKDRGIVNLLMRRHSDLKGVIESKLLSKEAVTAMVQDYASMDRAWRQALERHPSLRGSDYGDKDLLEHKKLQELGYDVAPMQP